MTTRPSLSKKSALPQYGDALWGRCPHCRQSAQAKISDRLVCYRCGWYEPAVMSRSQETPEHARD